MRDSVKKSDVAVPDLGVHLRGGRHAPLTVSGGRDRRESERDPLKSTAISTSPVRRDEPVSLSPAFDDQRSGRVDAAAGPALTRRELVLLLAAAVALQAIAWVVIYQLFVALKWGYIPSVATDVSGYADVGLRVVYGQWPYHDFPYEYPPLSILLFLLPPVKSTLAAFTFWFGVEMIAIGMLAAAITTAVATRLWTGLGRPLAAAAAFAVVVVAAGAIAVNRFDGAVALVLALALLCMVRRRWTLAGLILGLGFSLKLMPIAVVPLVLILATTRRKAVWAALAAALAAILPFVPFVLHDATGFKASFLGMQVGRGLQIESVAASPYLVAQLIHPGSASIGRPLTASLTITGAATGFVSSLAPLAVLVLLAIVYSSVWHSRGALRASNEGIPVAVLAVMLATLIGNKVLSPQHLLWVLPLVALCLVGRQTLGKVAGALLLVALALTQVEYPAMYFRQIRLDPAPLAVIAARNALLVAAFAVAVVAVWRPSRSNAESHVSKLSRVGASRKPGAVQTARLP